MEDAKVNFIQKRLNLLRLSLFGYVNINPQSRLSFQMPL